MRHACSYASRDSVRKNRDQTRRSGDTRGAQVWAPSSGADGVAVLDPLGARQLHVALARVDPVLGDHEGTPGAAAPDRGQQAGVAGGDRVVAGGARRRGRQHAQQRHVHRAQMPEQIQEGRVGGQRLRQLGEQRERGAPMQELGDGEIPAGELVDDLDRRLLLEVNAAEGRQHARRRGACVSARPRQANLFGQLGARPPVERLRVPLLAEDTMKGDRVRRHLEPRLAVGIGVRADVDHRERQIRVSENDVVHPRRHPARHVGISPLDQQADIDRNVCRCRRRWRWSRPRRRPRLRPGAPHVPSPARSIHPRVTSVPSSGTSALWRRAVPPRTSVRP